MDALKYYTGNVSSGTMDIDSVPVFIRKDVKDALLNGIPKTAEERITALEAAVAELESYIDSMGKTVLTGDGSEDSPFTWSVGCDLVPNAFYSYADHVWVWMGTAGTATAADEPGTSDFFAQWDI